MPLVFSMAWRNLLRNRRRTALTALMMGMAVAMCMTLLAFVGGVQGQLRDVLVRGALGHVQVTDADWPGRRAAHEAIVDAEVQVAAIERVDGVLGVAARVYGPALVGGPERTSGVQVIGLMPEREVQFRGFERQIAAGRWFGGAPAEAVIGADLAKSIDVGVGDTIVAMTQSSDGSLGIALYEVVVLLRTGSTAIDKSGVLIPIADAQSLFALEGRVHEITVVTDTDDESVTAALRDRVRAALTGADGLLVRAWFEVDPGTADIFRIQSVSMIIFVGLFMGVAATGVVNTLLMSVFERTREFGVLRALGFRPASLMVLVVVESLWIGALGVLGGGIVGGLGDLWVVTQGIDLSVNGEGMRGANVQFDPILYGRVTWQTIVYPVVGVLVFSVLAAIWPAWRVGRLQPIDAIRDL